MLNLITSEQLYEVNSKIIIDVRAPSEYADYHIHGAINIPLFTDEQRAEIGTTYKQVSSTEAKKLGAKLIASRFAEIVDELIDLCNEYENVIMYCHRGGMRSKSITALLTALDFKNVYKLEGGIKRHRNYVQESVKGLVSEKKFIILHGLTGVGKTKLLLNLEKENTNVLDYEGLANNAGSVFGNILYKEMQPTQKQFEESIFFKVKTSNSPYIFTESESKRVGAVNIPDEYMAKLDDGYHVLITADVKTRVSILISDYVYEGNHDALIECINKLRKRLSNEKADYLIELTNKNELEELVEILLIDYYDPLYNFSINKYLPYDYTIENNSLMNTTKKLVEILEEVGRK